MREDSAFKTWFFDFFEDVIKHDLPDKVIPGFDPKVYEPRTQRPPKPPMVPEHAMPEEIQTIMDEWDDIFVEEIKMCGETLQRHEHRKVCEKYGNEGQCRFLFPHEIVDASYFDSDTNSIVLLCRDGMVNYYNPYLLVFCRHNHDIRCILSGKSVKAAIFYIMEYITKTDVNTCQMLTLLSKAVLKMPEDPQRSVKDSARMLLHKCLTQFTRRQQIHAQQTVRYLCGLGDTISSHKTVPMLSNLLLAYVKKRYHLVIVGQSTAHMADSEHNTRIVIEPLEDVVANPNIQLANDEDLNLEGDDKAEVLYLKLSVDDSGNIMHSNQVLDYLHRADGLKNLSFFEFVQRFEVVRRRKKRDGDDLSLHCHRLLDPHPLSATHEICACRSRRVVSARKIGVIPRLVGASVPKPTHSGTYEMFILCHLKPFSTRCPLFEQGQTLASAWQAFTPTLYAQKIIDSWIEIHDCEDVWDAERLKRRESALHAEANLSKGKPIRPKSGEDNDELPSVSEIVNPSRALVKNVQLMDFTPRLMVARYLSGGVTGESFSNPNSESIWRRALVYEAGAESYLPSLKLQLWEKEIKAQQMAVKTSRQNLSNPENQTGSAWLEGLEGITLEGEHTIADVHKPPVDRDQYHTIGRTIFDQSGQLSVPESPSEVVERIVRDRSLNEQ